MLFAGSDSLHTYAFVFSTAIATCIGNTAYSLYAGIIVVIGMPGFIIK